MMKALIFLGFLATSCLAQAPAPAPTTTVSPSPMAIPPVTAETPSPVASPPVPVNEPTQAPTTSPTISPVASPPQTDALAPGPSSSNGLTPTSPPVPGTAGAADAPSAAWANKAFLVGTAVAGALYAVVLA